MQVVRNPAEARDFLVLTIVAVSNPMMDRTKACKQEWRSSKEEERCNSNGRRRERREWRWGQEGGQDRKKHLPFCQRVE